jgi:hypothetical protein
MTGIAISYRREDTAWITGRIFDRLKDHYEGSGRRDGSNNAVVFMDYDSMPVGVDFRKHIKCVLVEPVAKLHRRAKLSGLRGDLRGVRVPIR